MIIDVGRKLKADRVKKRGWGTRVMYRDELTTAYALKREDAFVKN